MKYLTIDEFLLSYTPDARMTCVRVGKKRQACQVSFLESSNQRRDRVNFLSIVYKTGPHGK